MISIKDRVVNNVDKPLLSVFCWAYNDEPYIDRCIEEILTQITDFPIEIIIHDDASKDRTTEIIIKYSLKYPGLFKNILNSDNMWSQGINVAIPLFTNPTGRYVALLHADDYWIDPLKLQKQVDFLENRKEYSFCFHKVSYLSDDVLSSYYAIPEFDTLNLKQILKTHYVATSSVVFRRSMLRAPYDVYSKMYFNDICLEIFLAIEGPVYYFDNIMGIYRNNSNGITKDLEHVNKGRKNLILIYKNLRDYLEGSHYYLITFLLFKLRLGFAKDFFFKKVLKK